MPNFTPNGIIYIGNVPFDNSYRHTMTFANTTAQANYFASVCTQALAKSDYTYVRMNNSIRVAFNAERLYTYDYVMYKNANYGDKWFYAFIVAVNYVNENCTELVLELDVMQTWYFDYTLMQGFVEREHVDDDTIGAHINAEPAMDLEYIYESFNPEYFSAKYACFLVSQIPKYKDLTPLPILPDGTYGQPLSPIEGVDGSIPVAGGFYQGQFNACNYILYDLNDNDSIYTMFRDLQAFNSAGCADGIVDAFTLPQQAFSAVDILPLDWDSGEYNTRYTVKTNCQPMVHQVSFPKPSTPGTNMTIDGYTPKNNKLFTYPYCYIELGDFTGRTEDLRYEFFGGERAELEVKSFGNGDSIGFVTPINYNGVNEGGTIGTNKSFKPFTFNYANKIPWVFSVYQTWAAQNQVANQLAVIGSIASIGVSAIPGIGAAASELGKGLGLAGGIAQIQGGGNLAQSQINYSYKKAGEAFKDNASLAGIGAGLGGLATVYANYERMKRTPNQARGNTNGNSRFQAGYTGWYESKVCIRNEFAKIVDGFFSMYGYQVDSVKIPNRTGRRNWNYVKMQNSCHRGTVPASDMDKINSIYDAGITFWHTSDVGNYSLDNSII